MSTFHADPWHIISALARASNPQGHVHANLSSSTLFLCIYLVNTNIDRGAETEGEDDDINSLRNEFEGLHTNDTPTRPLGRAATEPLLGSAPDSPERRARRRRL